jgi:hypothetical protein
LTSIAESFILGFATARMPDDDLEMLVKTVDFEGLVLDTQAPQGTRLRRFSRFRLGQGAWPELMPHESFAQPDSHGAVRSAQRRFEPLVLPDQSAEQWNPLSRVIAVAAGLAGISEAEVGVHAIRTVSADGLAGVPAPEGLHSDGFDYIAIVVCDTPPHGAETRLVTIADGSTTTFGTMRAGSVLVFDDRSFLHYTSPFHALAGAEVSRDVIVLTLHQLG